MMLCSSALLPARFYGRWASQGGAMVMVVSQVVDLWAVRDCYRPYRILKLD